MIHVAYCRRNYISYNGLVSPEAEMKVSGQRNTARQSPYSGTPNSVWFELLHPFIKP